MTTRRPVRHLAGKTASRRTDLGFILLGVASALVLVGLFVWGQRAPAQLDSELCPEGDDPVVQVIILLDPSDSLNVVQKGVVDRILRYLEDSIPERSEIRLYTVAASGRRDTVPKFRRCVPSHPIDSPGTNYDMMQRDYNDKFRSPLESNLRTLLDGPNDTVSPIVEAIQVSVVSAFRPRDAAIPRRLVIVSDMMQNSSDLSFYPPPTPDYEIFTRNPAYSTLRVDLSSVEVTVFLLARRDTGGPGASRQLKQFWEDYLLDQGAVARPRWVDVEG